MSGHPPNARRSLCPPLMHLLPHLCCMNRPPERSAQRPPGQCLSESLASLVATPRHLTAVLSPFIRPPPIDCCRPWAHLDPKHPARYRRPPLPANSAPARRPFPLFPRPCPYPAVTSQAKQQGPVRRRLPRLSPASACAPANPAPQMKPVAVQLRAPPHQSPLHRPLETPCILAPMLDPSPSCLPLPARENRPVPRLLCPHLPTHPLNVCALLYVCLCKRSGRHNISRDQRQQRGRAAGMACRQQGCRREGGGAAS